MNIRARILELERAQENLRETREDECDTWLTPKDFEVLNDLLNTAIKEAKCHTSIPS